MTEQNPFKWRHFQAEIILLCVRWYVRYALSSREPSRDDVRTGSAHRSHHDLPLSFSSMPQRLKNAVGLI